MTCACGMWMWVSMKPGISRCGRWSTTSAPGACGAARRRRRRRRRRGRRGPGSRRPRRRRRRRCRRCPRARVRKRRTRPRRIFSAMSFLPRAGIARKSSTWLSFGIFSGVNAAVGPAQRRAVGSVSPARPRRTSPSSRAPRRRALAPAATRSLPSRSLIGPAKTGAEPSTMPAWVALAAAAASVGHLPLKGLIWRMPSLKPHQVSARLPLCRRASS